MRAPHADAWHGPYIRPTSGRQPVGLPCKVHLLSTVCGARREQTLGLVFVAVYQKALKLLYVDALLEQVKQVSAPGAAHACRLLPLGGRAPTWAAAAGQRPVPAVAARRFQPSADGHPVPQCPA